jgi:carboxymethylenebutenolidase
MYQARTDEVHFEGAGDVQAWISRPVEPGRYPAIVLLHGRNGAGEGFRSVGVRFAEEGFVGLAVNYFTNGEPPNPEIVPTIGGALEFLKAQADVEPDQIALGGYCRGGTLTWMGLASYPGYAAGVLWHAGIPQEALSVQVPIIILHAASDASSPITGVYDLTQKLNEQGKQFQLKVYSGLGHAFAFPGAQFYERDATDDAFREAVFFLRRRYGLPLGSVAPLVPEPVPA